MAAPAPAPKHITNFTPAVRVLQTNEKVTGPPGADMLRRALQLSSHIDKSQGGSQGQQPLEVLDNACGGGIVADELFRLLSRPSSNTLTLKRVVAADIDEKMTSYVRNRAATDPIWTPHKDKVEVVQADMRAASPQLLASGSFTHVLNNFGVFASRDDAAVLAEALRVLYPNGGVAGFTGWKALAWWTSLALPAMAAFVPEAPALVADPSMLFPGKGWDDPVAARAKLEGAGFVDVEVHEYAFTPEVGAEEFAEACAILMTVVTMRLWSAEQRERYGPQIGPAVLRYLKENWEGGKWDGTMVAVVALGKKA